jgi:predicted metalloprotease
VTRRAPVFLAVTTTLAAVLAACSVSADVAVERSNQLVGTAPPPDTVDDPAATTTEPGSTTPSDATGPTTPRRPADELFIEGNAKPERAYDQLVRDTVVDLEQWWSEKFPQLYGEDYEPLSGGVFPAYPDRSDDIPGCGSSSNTTYEEVQQYAAFYCSLGDFIVYDDGDNGMIVDLTSELGNSVIAVVLAHEWGHAIQTRNGTFEQNLPTIRTEQQADCFAGAWTRRAVDGTIANITFTDADVRAGLVAMIQVRDPPGFDQLQTGGHGSGFDRVGAFQVGYLNGVERCVELIDSPLPLVPNKFLSTTSDGNADWGYSTDEDDFQIPGGLPKELNRYWQAYFTGIGRQFPELSIEPVAADDDVECPDLSGPVERGAAYCPSNSTVYFDEAFAREQYDTFGDFTVGYLLGVAWAEAAQRHLDSPLTGETRALLNDCLAGTWVNDIIPNEGETAQDRVYIEAGDLDEAIQTLIIVGDPTSDDDRIGSGFEKIDYFREGVLNDVAACQAQLDERDGGD